MRVGLVFLFSLSACCGSVAFGVPSADIGQPPFSLLPAFPLLSVPPHGLQLLDIVSACLLQSRFHRNSEWLVRKSLRLKSRCNRFSVPGQFLALSKNRFFKLVSRFHNQNSNNEGWTCVSFFAVGLLRFCSFWSSIC